MKNTIKKFAFGLVLVGGSLITNSAISGSCTVSRSCGSSANDFVTCSSDVNDCHRYANAVECDGVTTSCTGTQQ